MNILSKIKLISIAMFMLSCQSTANKSQMNNKNTVTTIVKGNLYGSGAEGINKENFIINNPNDWDALLTKLNSVNTVSDGFLEQNIDFEKYTIIAVFDEQKTTGGHSIAIDIIYNSERIIVNAIQKSPNGMATTVMTQPYCIVKIAKTNLPILFK